MNGFVYISHIQGPGGSLHLSYWTRDDAHKVLETAKGDRLIHSVADLEAALQLSLTQPLRMVFVAEGAGRRGALAHPTTVFPPACGRVPRECLMHTRW